MLFSAELPLLGCQRSRHSLFGTAPGSKLPSHSRVRRRLRPLGEPRTGPRIRFLARGGDNRARTGDLLLAKQALSQLSYIPTSLDCNHAAQAAAATSAPRGLVGLGRVELPTSRLSGVRSNQTEL